ncbi:hypothetical protein ACWEO4_41610, partial [Streptomyces sp. NPDC004393]
HHSNLVRSHTLPTPHQARRTRTTTADLTKPYYLFNIKASGPGQGLRPFRDPDAAEDDEN